MSTEENMFYKMFLAAEQYKLSDFNDEDLKEEGISFPRVTSYDEVAAEGYLRAMAGSVVRDFTGLWSEVKGWFTGANSKKNYVDEKCKDLIDWLKDKDIEYPKLNLDTGTIKTWFKTSETFYWRYYFLLHDGIYNNLINQLKKNEITQLEDLTDFDITNRKEVTRMLDSVKSIPDMIVIVEKYRSRSNNIFEKLFNRKREVKSFPFQVMLLGYVDLDRTVKQIVNLAI